MAPKCIHPCINVRGMWEWTKQSNLNREHFFLPVAHRTDCPEAKKKQRCFELSSAFRASSVPEGKHKQKNNSPGSME